MIRGWTYSDEEQRQNPVKVKVKFPRRDVIERNISHNIHRLQAFKDILDNGNKTVFSDIYKEVGGSDSLWTALRDSNILKKRKGSKRGIFYWNKKLPITTYMSDKLTNEAWRRDNLNKSANIIIDSKINDKYIEEVSSVEPSEADLLLDKLVKFAAYLNTTPTDNDGEIKTLFDDDKVFDIIKGRIIIKDTHWKHNKKIPITPKLAESLVNMKNKS